jgi:hypothetical protein
MWVFKNERERETERQRRKFKMSGGGQCRSSFHLRLLIIKITIKVCEQMHLQSSVPHFTLESKVLCCDISRFTPLL